MMIYTKQKQPLFWKESLANYSSLKFCPEHAFNFQSQMHAAAKVTTLSRSLAFSSLSSVVTFYSSEVYWKLLFLIIEQNVR